MKNLFLVSKDGQLANRLWQASYFLSNAIENKYTVNHLFFGDYYLLFSESIKKNSMFPIRFIFSKYGLGHSLLETLLRRTMKLLSKWKIRNIGFAKIIYSFNESEWIDLAKSDISDLVKSNNVLIFGWNYLDSINIYKHKKEVVDYWTPNAAYTKQVDYFNNLYREHAELLVGVHIRRGDYQSFNGGKYFYDNSIYQKIMFQFSGLSLAKDKKIVFCICSDDKSVALVTPFICFEENRPFIVDLYLLAMCDFIIGPPSTFSAWASFYGDKPLAYITDKNMILKEDDFFVSSNLL